MWSWYPFLVAQVCLGKTGLEVNRVDCGVIDDRWSSAKVLPFRVYGLRSASPSPIQQIWHSNKPLPTTDGGIRSMGVLVVDAVVERAGFERAIDLGVICEQAEDWDSPGDLAPDGEFDMNWSPRALWYELVPFVLGLLKGKGSVLETIAFS